MPESHKAERRRTQKANRDAGVGDENGRMVRVKDPPKMSSCTQCSCELRITKTNTELTAHSTGKHGKTLEECFPGSTAAAADLVAAATKGGSSSQNGNGAGGGKAKKSAANMDDLLNSGLSAGKKGKK
jgi:hypothetical protein